MNKEDFWITSRLNRFPLMKSFTLLSDAKIAPVVTAEPAPALYLMLAASVALGLYLIDYFI